MPNNLLDETEVQAGKCLPAPESLSPGAEKSHRVLRAVRPHWAQTQISHLTFLPSVIGTHEKMLWQKFVQKPAKQWKSQTLVASHKCLYYCCPWLTGCGKHTDMPWSPRWQSHIIEFLPGFRKHRRERSESSRQPSEGLQHQGAVWRSSPIARLFPHGGKLPIQALMGMLQIIPEASDYISLWPHMGVEPAPTGFPQGGHAGDIIHQCQ